MKTQLFDASAIILLIKRQPDTASTTLEGEYILNLTPYEVGNALWKINKLIDKTSQAASLDAVEEAHTLLSLMDVLEIEGVEDHKQTMAIAYEKNLSFYDSAYIQVAKRMGLTLMTEDKRLLHAAEEIGIKCG
jgi:predicted nucleic acid-binding protein